MVKHGTEINAPSLPGIAPLIQSIEHCGKAKDRLKDLTNVLVGCKLDISLTWPVYVVADDVPRPSGHILPQVRAILHMSQGSPDSFRPSSFSFSRYLALANGSGVL